MQCNEKLKSQKILVVDGSRVVRASLMRCASASHGVCEAPDGESAWQSIVLDTSIIAVISGLSVASEEGADLLERIRSSRSWRIKKLSFYQLASDNLPNNEREQAERLGITAFIPKKAPAATLAGLFAQAVGESETDTVPRGAAGADESAARRPRSSAGGPVSVAPAAVAAVSGETGRLPLNGGQKLPLKKEIGVRPAASVLIFGIDDYAGLRERFGQRLAEKVVDKFSRMLRQKIRAHESVLPLTDGRIGIASDNLDDEQCTSFANRVCKTLAETALSVGGKKIKVTVSAGVVVTSAAGDESNAEKMFYLAANRLDAAVAAGGNRVVSASEGGPNLRQGEFIARLASLLTTSSRAAEMPCKAWINSLCTTCRNACPEEQTVPCGAGGLLARQAAEY
jgi:diguanylate cyclase (GGDEF)-like protein